MSQNRFTQTLEELAAGADSAAGEPPIHVVRLFHNTGEQAERLVEAPAVRDEVQELFLGEAEPRGSLTGSNNIRQLTLQRMEEGTAALGALAPGLACNRSVTLSCLDSASAPGVIAVLGTLAKRGEVPQQSLVLSRCRLHQPHELLALAHAAMHTLHALQLVECSMGRGGAAMLLSAMAAHAAALPPVQPQPSHPSLGIVCLDLSACRLDADDARAAAALLTSSTMLKSLVLSNNAEMGDAGTDGFGADALALLEWPAYAQLFMQQNCNRALLLGGRNTPPTHTRTHTPNQSKNYVQVVTIRIDRTSSPNMAHRVDPNPHI